MAEIRRVTQINRPGPKIRVDRVLKVDHIDYMVLAPTVQGYGTHWYGKPTGTKACLDPSQECPGCIAGKPKRDKFYLHCLSIEARAEVFLELTPYGALELKNQAPAGDVLRGLKIRVYRSSAKSNGRQYVEILNMERYKGKLPEPKDPYETLQYLWGLVEEFPRELKAFVG